MLVRIEARPRTTIDTLFKTLFDAERFPRVPHSRGKEFPCFSTINQLTQNLYDRLAAPPPSAIELITYPRNDPLNTSNRDIDLYNEQQR
jgi:hypothetical protein